MFSTSSPTYPASVSVVASPIANGTLRNSRQRLGQQRLAAAGRPDQQHVALVDLDIRSGLLLGFIGDAQSLVMIVHRHRQRPLGVFLADRRTDPGIP
jgi:hypothetical protein